MASVAAGLCIHDAAPDPLRGDLPVVLVMMSGLATENSALVGQDVWRAVDPADENGWTRAYTGLPVQMTGDVLSLGALDLVSSPANLSRFNILPFIYTLSSSYGDVTLSGGDAVVSASNYDGRLPPWEVAQTIAPGAPALPGTSMVTLLDEEGVTFGYLLDASSRRSAKLYAATKCAMCGDNEWSQGCINFSPYAPSCKPCTVCTPGTYTVNNCSSYENAWCYGCTVCAAGSYAAVPCYQFSDTTCSPCTPCVAGAQWTTANCTPEVNTACALCTTCPTGWIVTAACNEWADTVCAPPHIIVLATPQPLQVLFAVAYAVVGSVALVALACVPRAGGAYSRGEASALLLPASPAAAEAPPPGAPAPDTRGAATLAAWSRAAAAALLRAGGGGNRHDAAGSSSYVVLSVVAAAAASWWFLLSVVLVASVVVTTDTTTAPTVISDWQVAGRAVLGLAGVHCLVNVVTTTVWLRRQAGAAARHQQQANLLAREAPRAPPLSVSGALSRWDVLLLALAHTRSLATQHPDASGLAWVACLETVGWDVPMLALAGTLAGAADALNGNGDGGGANEVAAGVQVRPDVTVVSALVIMFVCAVFNLLWTAAALVLLVSAPFRSQLKSTVFVTAAAAGAAAAAPASPMSPTGASGRQSASLPRSSPPPSGGVGDGGTVAAGDGTLRTNVPRPPANLRGVPVWETTDGGSESARVPAGGGGGSGVLPGLVTTRTTAAGGRASTTPSAGGAADGLSPHTATSIGRLRHMAGMAAVDDDDATPSRQLAARSVAYIPRLASPSVSAPVPAGTSAGGGSGGGSKNGGSGSGHGSGRGGGPHEWGGGGSGGSGGTGPGSAASGGAGSGGAGSGGTGPGSATSGTTGTSGATGPSSATSGGATSGASGGTTGRVSGPSWGGAGRSYASEYTPKVVSPGGAGGSVYTPKLTAPGVGGGTPKPLAPGGTPKLTAHGGGGGGGVATPKLPAAGSAADVPPADRMTTTALRLARLRALQEREADGGGVPHSGAPPAEPAADADADAVSGSIDISLT